MPRKPKTETPEQTEEKRGRGRPSAYKPEYAKQAAKLCQMGATDADLADFFEVTITTIRNWYSQYPDFLASQKANKVDADGRVERSLYQRATGYTYDSVKVFMPAGAAEPVIVPIREHVPPDTTAMIFWLKNRRPTEWRDKIQQEVSGPDGGPIEISTAEKTVTDALAKIEAALRANGGGKG